MIPLQGYFCYHMYFGLDSLFFVNFPLLLGGVALNAPPPPVPLHGSYAVLDIDQSKTKFLKNKGTSQGAAKEFGINRSAFYSDSFCGFFVCRKGAFKIVQWGILPIQLLWEHGVTGLNPIVPTTIIGFPVQVRKP